MILIFSNNNERTTTEVIKWLTIMKKEFIRVYEDEIFTIKIINKRFFLESYRNTFFIDQIKTVWFRRGGLRFKTIAYKNTEVNLHMYEHQHWLQDYVRSYLQSLRTINKETDFYVNKLTVLDEVQKVGLKVPKYFLSESHQDIIPNKYITKTITGNGEIEFEDEVGMIYTSVVASKPSQDFFISFFQEKIEKDFEIRTFYQNETCWSMAIFSQNDDQTKVDYRKYNRVIPNRNVPYNLPKEIEEKIKELMKKLDINCGSIDFIKSFDDFYFLEVNPIGQFGNVSTYCNYNLAKELADFL